MVPKTKTESLRKQTRRTRHKENVSIWEYRKVGKYLQWASTSLKKEVWKSGLVDSMLRVTLVS